MSGTAELELGVDKQAWDEMLFVDDEGKIRDRHIEQLFNACFYGQEICDVFKHNFRQYYQLLIGNEVMIPDGIFDNVTEAKRWVSTNFAPVLLRKPERQAITSDPDLAHCTAKATFAPLKPGKAYVYDIASCYAPTQLHAVLMLPISIFREVASDFNERRMQPVNDTKH